MKPDLLVPRVILKDVRCADDLPELLGQQYHTHLLCHQGQLGFELNNESFQCVAGEFLFWFSGSHLSNLQFSQHFKSTALLVESNFLNDNVPDQNWSINAVIYTRKHPVKSLNDTQLSGKILLHFKRLNQCFLETDHTFYEERLRLQMRIFILEMWHIFSEQYERYKYSLQTGTLYERFVHLLEQYCMQEREVQFYAERLFITPKHLNYICKTATDVTASQWIQRYARERIALLLQNTAMNIAEIADEMAFSSRSFFTRYVKKLLGVTPTQFRNRLG